MNIFSLLTSKKNAGEDRHQKRERLQKFEQYVFNRMDKMAAAKLEVKVKLIRSVFNELK